jgi:hypothetical protein
LSTTCKADTDTDRSPPATSLATQLGAAWRPAYREREIAAGIVACCV